MNGDKQGVSRVPCAAALAIRLDSFDYCCSWDGGRLSNEVMLYSLEDVSMAVDGAQNVHRNDLFYCIWKIFHGCASPSLVEIVGHVREIPSQERVTDIEGNYTL